MSRRIAALFSLNLLLITGLVFTVSAQEGAGKAKAKGGKAKVVPARPGMVLKEVWKNPSGQEHPLSQADVATGDLEIEILGNAGEGVMMTGSDNLDANPSHWWTGVNESPSAVMLRSKTKMYDLTGLSRIKANIKTSGLHQVRPVVKLADGTYLIAEMGVGTFTDWLNYEWAIGDQRWLRLDPKRVVTTGTWVNNADLSKVDAIGFADLMPGSGHGPGGWVDIAQIEVYGKTVDR